MNPPRGPVTAAAGPPVPDDDAVVGVLDVGGSHVLTATATGQHGAEILHDRQRTPVDSAGDRATLLDQLTSAASSLPASAWAVAMPGPFDYALGQGDFAGVGKFAALAGVDLRSEFASRWGVPGDAVQFVNDAQAYGIGEWSTMAERPGRLVCLTLGTGVGSAWLVDGSPVEDGADVPPRGWAHLLTLDGAPLEDTVSTRAITADYTRRTGRRLDVRGIADEVRAGESAATASWHTAMQGLGRALGPWLHRFGAERLVIGGSMARSWDLLQAPLIDGIASVAASVPAVSASALLDDAPLIGAAYWLRHRGAERSRVRTP